MIGVLVGLLMVGSTLSMFSIIGFIMLMGLVVKNAILLVDNANQRVREDHTNLQPEALRVERHGALLMSARVRLRPILMTTLAMIFGMVPLALCHQRRLRAARPWPMR